MSTQVKSTPINRHNVVEKPKNQENSNPNMTSPGLNLKPSPKSARGAKTVQKNPSPKKKIRERKFVVAKKSNANSKKQDLRVECKCKDRVNGKCLCVAYESLRASQEDFFKSKDGEKGDNGTEFEGIVNEFEPEEGESPKGEGLGSSTMKRRRDMLLVEARESVPESGRVMHLVKAFERLLTLPKKSEKAGDGGDENEEGTKGLRWALPGLQQPPPQPPRAPETQESSSAFCPGEYFFSVGSLGLDVHVSSSLDSSRGSVSSRSSNSSRRSRRSGSFSSGTVGGRKWKKEQRQQQHRVTSLRPFKLRTEQRGKAKEVEFVKKLQEMMIEEEKQRIPLAQGLPWTTDEPECLIKPPVKEATRPIDLKLHSDVRALERADFDYQVAEKMTMAELYKMEKERQQKLEEEEEIRRLRKELVPKAQPMPYFDRPFCPRRSVKQPTVPREPKFHFPQQKKIKCCVSLDDLNDYINAT